VYSLGTEDFYVRDGLLLVNDLVIDDRNQPGDTLGKRRLQTPHKKRRLVNAYEEFLDIVKENPSVLIDNRGFIFSYAKTKFEKIKSVKIVRKDLQETHSRIWLRGINFAFIVKEPPLAMNWAQVLYLNSRPWLLYGLSEGKLVDSKRKI
jgi:hypothetical protein